MDSTEAQLKFGSALAGTTLADEFTAAVPPTAPPPPPPPFARDAVAYSNAAVDARRAAAKVAAPGKFWNGPRRLELTLLFVLENENANSASRRDFLQYALSLMRSHSGEHGDDLPMLELSSLRHVAYVVDALLYFLNTKNPAIKTTAADFSLDYSSCGDLCSANVVIFFF